MNKKWIQFAASAALVTGLLAAPGFPEFAVPEKQAEAKGKTYTITPKSKPKKKNYLKSNKYTKYTKNYYTLRDRLESLEKSRGGTIIFKKGTYSYQCLKQNMCSGVRENYVRINWRYKDYAAKHSKTIYLKEY